MRRRHGASGREAVSEGDEECCNRVRECKRERERGTCDQSRPVASLRSEDLECCLSTSKESFPLDENDTLAYIANRSAFTIPPFYGSSNFAFK